MDASVLDYNLPEERIAKYPSQKRDDAKLLVYERKSGLVTHAKFSDLPSILDRKYDFVTNDASVIKARIFCKKDSGAAVECLLLSPQTDKRWECLLRPAKRLKIGAHFGIDGLFRATVAEKFDDARCIVEFETQNGIDVLDVSEKAGVVPLPPYIRRNQNSPDYDRTFDNERYQTVYADPTKKVAAAAPTAGLHFTPELIELLKSRGHEFRKLTLHVGIGTFRPLQSDVVEEHKMHSEFYEIPADTVRAVCARTLPTLAVGTTSLRALEDFFRKNPDAQTGAFAPRAVFDSASLFVYPPQRIISADAMITNFHLPRSTLMCLVATFLTPDSADGIKILKELYKTAVERQYNFFSYGDAMLIL